MLLLSPPLVLIAACTALFVLLDFGSVLASPNLAPRPASDIQDDGGQDDGDQDDGDRDDGDQDDADLNEPGGDDWDELLDGADAPAGAVEELPEGLELSPQELTELAALEELEANDGLASTQRLNQLRRKRARLARRAARAQGGHHEGVHHRWALGFRGTGLAVLQKDAEAHGLGGVGGFVEFAAAKGELDLELSARVLFEDGHLGLPVDLLFKKPWHKGDFVFYLGVGPSAIFGVELGEEEADASEPSAEESTAGDDEAIEAPPDVHFGFAGVGGMTWWLRPRVGVTAELNYNIVIDGGAVHELGASLGMTFAL